jgi:hypothetical protein
MTKPLRGTYTPVGEPERFLKEVILKFEGDDCLLWPYAKANYGYAEIRFGGSAGRKRLVHRVVCEAIHGPAPEGKNDAAHSCGNRLCVNPRHIRWATRKENNDDKLIHGTSNRGERHGMAKLTADDVREIRSLRGKIKQREIAARFGINRNTVLDIQTGKRWSWLE